MNVIIAVFVVLGFSSSSYGAMPIEGSDHEATHEEVAVLIFHNMLRANPSAVVESVCREVPPGSIFFGKLTDCIAHYGGFSMVRKSPLRWREPLADMARSHSGAMAERNCNSHDQCGDGTFQSRAHGQPGITGENIVANGSAESVSFGWMGDTGHRNNILGDFRSIGVGIRSGDFGAFTTADYSTEPAPNRLISGASVLQNAVNLSEYRFLASYTDDGDYEKGPLVKRVRVGKSCLNLSPYRVIHPGYGTYELRQNMTGQGCLPVVFEFVSHGGRVDRYPAKGSFMVGLGSFQTGMNPTSGFTNAKGLCPYIDENVEPPADCGGDILIPEPNPKANLLSVTMAPIKYTDSRGRERPSVRVVLSVNLMDGAEPIQKAFVTRKLYQIDNGQQVLLKEKTVLSNASGKLYFTPTIKRSLSTLKFRLDVSAQKAGVELGVQSLQFEVKGIQ